MHICKNLIAFNKIRIIYSLQRVMKNYTLQHSHGQYLIAISKVIVLLLIFSAELVIEGVK